MKKRVALMLAAMSIVASFAGCGGFNEEGGEKVDAKKTQLYVHSYGGGVGNDWLTAIADKFEKEYAETSFEPGTDKKGVQIITDTSKSDQISIIANNKNNIIFAEAVAFNALSKSGLVLDITDVVTELNLDGKTIESKLDSTMKDALTVNGGQYYALPHYEYYPGVTFDRDVFDEYFLYIGEDGSYTNFAGARSKGPDGKTGVINGVDYTYDDGLPATITEFLNLCEQMAMVGVEPIIYTGAYPSYGDMFIMGLMAALSEKDEFLLNFSFDSYKGGTLSEDEAVKMKIIDEFSGNTPVVTETVITPETGYLTTKHAAKYYALNTLETIIKTSKYLSESISDADTHLMAQEDFIYSKLEGKPIAMLFEGSFWYEEASIARDNSETEFGESAKNRNFAWMPLPTQVSEAKEKKESFLVNEANSYVVINANIKTNENLVNLSKLFLKYCYTDENLQLFTQESNCFKGVNYEIEGEQYEKLDRYTQSIVDLRKSNTVIVPMSNSPVYLADQTNFFFQHCFYFKTKTNASAIGAIKGNKSMKSFFEEMQIGEAQWTSAYSQYFN